ncbi:TIGR04141 family sporadically distributed protein [Streptomyces bacillaris]|uniref:TIGR04141 family sporadically distributed protein n=1 Tax=Streptomyces bacillaris TaxID=68179 RepID=UPI0035DCD68A
MAPTTVSRTLYRLHGVAPTREAMYDALDHDYLSALGAELHTPDSLGVPAVYLTCGMEQDEAGWCEQMARTTGIPVTEAVRRTAALLLLAVDGQVYAIGCDQGYRLIPEQLKDKRFGLSFAIREIDPTLVRGAVSGILGQARTDISLVPNGAPVPALGLSDHTRIVRSLGGYLNDAPLTRTLKGRAGGFSVLGGCGLRLPLGVEPADLVSDIRQIARACTERLPHQDLEFVEHIVPVKDETVLTQLERALDGQLGLPADGRIAETVPFDHLRNDAEAATYRTRINSDGSFESDAFDLGYVLGRVRYLPSGGRLEALKSGTVKLLRERRRRSAPDDVIATVGTLRWIEATVSLGSHVFCLLDGEWYEFGASYLASLHTEVQRLFAPVPSVVLPAWPRGMSETPYNKKTARTVGWEDWVVLDCKTIPNPAKPSDQIEICDFLTQDDTLVLVKQARGSGALSHLYNQARVAVEVLYDSAVARANFAQRVRIASDGRRTLPDDFLPKRLVLAIHLKTGAELTPDSLFGFSQITLAQTAKALAARGVSLEVVGISAAGSAADGGLADAA